MPIPCIPWGARCRYCSNESVKGGPPTEKFNKLGGGLEDAREERERASESQPHVRGPYPKNEGATVALPIMYNQLLWKHTHEKPHRYTFISFLFLLLFFPSFYIIYIYARICLSCNTFPVCALKQYDSFIFPSCSTCAHTILYIYSC